MEMKALHQRDAFAALDVVIKTLKKQDMTFGFRAGRFRDALRDTVAAMEKQITDLQTEYGLPGVYIKSKDALPQFTPFRGNNDENVFTYLLTISEYESVKDIAGVEKIKDAVYGIKSEYTAEYVAAVEAINNAMLPVPGTFKLSDIMKLDIDNHVQLATSLHDMCINDIDGGDL